MTNTDRDTTSICDMSAEDLSPFVEELSFLEDVTGTAETRFSAGGLS